MNHRERLAICTTCRRRRIDFDYGYVCKLTGSVADFQGTCKDYLRDETVTNNLKIRTEKRPFVPLFEPRPEREEQETRKKKSSRAARPKAARPKAARPTVARSRTAPSRVAPSKAAPSKAAPSKVARKKIRRYQSFLYALLGGVLMAAIASLGWAFATAMTGYQGVYMALGAGLLVGIAVRFFGAGVKWIFGILAALLALAASLLGYYLGQAGFPEEVQLAGIMGVPDYLKPELILNTLLDSFVPLDLLFYGLTALLAYFLSIRRISKRKMAKLELEGYKGAPALYWLRLPLILAVILLPVVYGYTLTNGDSVEYKTLFYESGNKMSEGALRNGLETGEWTSWYENGNIQSTGYYFEGKKDSLWKWYDESGVLSGTGSYAVEEANGTWIRYYPDGVVSDSGSFLNGLKEGLWEYFHENGSLKYSMHYKAGKLHGEKILLSSSGDVVNVEHYENGLLVEQE